MHSHHGLNSHIHIQIQIQILICIRIHIHIKSRIYFSQCECHYMHPLPTQEIISSLLSKGVEKSLEEIAWGQQ